MSISLLAQSNLSLSGSVKDQNGLTIPSATVLLRPTSGANPKTQDTDPAGNYRFSNLTPGRYTLEISKGGFQLFTKQLDLKTNATEDAALEILSQAQTMTVEATLGKTTGTRMDIPKDEIPISISTIPVQTIVEQGSNDLVSALRNASGVSAYLWYGVYEYYTIRGFNIQDVQLADGMRLQGNRLNTQINNIESVEILKGPASVNYGGGALAGAINLIRKKPQPTPLYDFNFTAGRFRNYRAGLGLTGSLFGSTKLQYRLDAQFADIEGWRQAGARRFNVTPALVWQPTSRDRITIHQAFNADRYDGDPGIPLAALDLPNAPLNRNFRTPSDFERFRDSLTQIQYNRTLGEQWEFRSAFQYRRSFDQYLV
ncbi:MAG: TonB-dependent receptor, partial [Bryobacteraceae bacterium]|nr:TonB-dependent receptor [Bryobacteraceae bacterium]